LDADTESAGGEGMKKLEGKALEEIESLLERVRKGEQK
jgi:hypothetical protein